MSAKDHLERIHELPCIVCRHMGMGDIYGCEAHHLEIIRDELSHYASVPLCKQHHTSMNGVHGLSRSGFFARYKLTDVDLLALTIRALEKAGRLK